MKNRQICALDVGTGTIRAATAEVLGKDNIKIIKKGTAPSAGMKGGAVVDMDDLAMAVRKALDQAEVSPGPKIKEVYASMIGGRLRTTERYGVVMVKNDASGVTDSDVDRVLQKAREEPIPSDEEVIHLTPSEFAVDGVGGVRQPAGMAGQRLDVKAILLLAKKAPAENLLRSIDGSVVKVKALGVQPFMAAEAVLDGVEKKDGVILIDMGAGTTDVAVFGGGSLRQASMIRMGGNHLTRDISVGLRIPWPQAEEIKVKDGTVSRLDASKKTDSIYLSALGGKENRKISHTTVAEILEARVQEISSEVKQQLGEVDFNDYFPRKFVLTGGGSYLSGIKEYLERELRLPGRIGLPKMPGGLPAELVKPENAVLVGLMCFGQKHFLNEVSKENQREEMKLVDRNILSRIKTIWQDFLR